MTGKVKLLMAWAAMLSCLACSNTDAVNDHHSQPPATQAQAVKPAHDRAVAKEASTLSRARSAILEYQLTRLAPDCLKLALENTSDTVYEIEVYELHNEKCGGDPQTLPRLFGLHLSRTNSKVWSDAKSEDGDFELLTP